MDLSVDQYRELTAKPEGKKPARKEKTKAEWLAHFRSTPARPAAAPGLPAQRALFERHDAAVMRLWLPLPPSKNRLKRIVALPGHRPFLRPSHEAEAYVLACQEAWKSHWKGWPPDPLGGRLRVLMTVYTRQAGGDVANREEALCDALTACQAWLDDGQIDDLRVLRGGVLRPTGGLDLIIETIEEAA